MDVQRVTCRMAIIYYKFSIIYYYNEYFQRKNKC